MDIPNNKPINVNWFSFSNDAGLNQQVLVSSSNTNIPIEEEVTFRIGFYFNQRNFHASKNLQNF